MPWRVPVAAGALGLVCLLVLVAAPVGEPDPGWAGPAFSWWQGQLTPLLSVATAVVVLGLVERSIAIMGSGLLGMDRPAPALVMTLPLALIGIYRALRSRGQSA